MNRTHFKRVSFPAVLALMLAGFSASSLAAVAPGLEERMSQEQFRSYGLDKLTPDELRGLEDWLSRHAEKPAAEAIGAAPVVRDPRLGFREKSGERVAVNAHLVGTFSGWSGSTIFKLDNGQEWQQVEPGAYSGQRVDNAAITIKPKMMGNWLLVVEQCQCRVAVKRIK